MAKPGVSSRLARGESRSSATKQTLVEAAIETLKIEGFGGASARAIAERAGCNQALVFYHFGSVADLLLAALDAVSAARLERYGLAVADVTSPVEILDIAADIFSEDLDAGHAAVLVEMIAGASSTPGLGAEVAQRVEPWKEFARRAIDRALDDSPLRSVVPAEELAHGVVALYLGLELLTHLDGDRASALKLFDRARTLVGALASLGATAPAAPARNQQQV